MAELVANAFTPKVPPGECTPFFASTASGGGADEELTLFGMDGGDRDNPKLAWSGDILVPPAPSADKESALL